MKIIKSPATYLFLCFLSLGIFLGWWIWATSPPCDVNCSTITFTVSRGESLSSIGYRLRKVGLIRSPLVFKVLSSYLRVSGKIQAGDFRLNSNMAPREIAQQFTHGASDLKVTLIEGWRREEIAEKFSQVGLENFNRKEFLESTAGLEGKLFPDTYFLSRKADTVQIISLLTKTFDKKAGSISEQNLILASLVEREVPHEDDRPVVAGILQKRLAAGWPLQVDATIQYLVGNTRCRRQPENCDWWPNGLTASDLKINSSYNTYLNLGLPPTPICNPGLSAIKAVLNSIPTDYWYYLSDKSGNTHFAKTAEEHNQNIQKYLLGR